MNINININMNKDKVKFKDKVRTNDQEKASRANTEEGFSSRLLAAKKRAADKER